MSFSASSIGVFRAASLATRSLRPGTPVAGSAVFSGSGSGQIAATESSGTLTCWQGQSGSPLLPRGAADTAPMPSARKASASMIRDGALNRANLHSPCPSPHGRGDAFSTGTPGLPLPEGEGWGEGLNASIKPQPRILHFLCPEIMHALPCRAAGRSGRARDRKRRSRRP